MFVYQYAKFSFSNFNAIRIEEKRQILKALFFRIAMISKINTLAEIMFHY